MSWSFSSYCNPTGECTPAMQRGKTIHALLADIMVEVREINDRNLTSGMPYETKVMVLGLQHEYNMHWEEAETEKELAVDKYWQPTSYANYNAWCRAKLDLVIPNYVYEGNLLIVDWKTGYPDLDKDMEQIKLYSVIGLANYEQMKCASPMLCYVDRGYYTPDPPVRWYRYDLEYVKWEWEGRIGI